jgi:transcriptional regulator with XRE-family HTH domain
MDFYEKDIFVQRLLDAAAKAGKTKEEVSEEAGMSTRTLYYMTKEYKVGPRVDVLFQLCKVLDVSADYLLGLTDA